MRMKALLFLGTLVFVFQAFAGQGSGVSRPLQISGTVPPRVDRSVMRESGGILLRPAGEPSLRVYIQDFAADRAPASEARRVTLEEKVTKASRILIEAP